MSNCSIGQAVIANAEVIGNEYVIGPVAIGDDVYVGSSAVIGFGSVLEDGAEIADLTSIAPGQRVGKCEKWDGSPGRKVGMVDLKELPAQAQASVTRRTIGILFSILMLLAIPPLGLVPILPAFYFYDRLAVFVGSFSSINYLYLTPLVAWPTAMALIALTVLLIAAIRWIVLPRVKPGVYSIHSFFYWRMWLVGLCTAVTLGTLNSLYATFYMRWWYRLMGAKIGRGAEISTQLGGRYDLVEIGANCFIADEVVLGEEDTRRGYMTLGAGEDRRPHLRRRIRPSCRRARRSRPGALIGVKSKPPGRIVGGSRRSGSARRPCCASRRARPSTSASNWTFEPSFARKLGRAVFGSLLHLAADRAALHHLRRVCGRISRPRHPRRRSRGPHPTIPRRRRAHLGHDVARRLRSQMAADGGL